LYLFSIIKSKFPRLQKLARYEGLLPTGT